MATHEPVNIETIRSDPKANLLRLLDEPQRFREWLAKQPPRQCVGVRFNSQECPTAKWLSEEVGRSCAVGTTYVLVLAETVQVTPDWLIAFVRKVDMDVDHSGVRASTCLRILDEVLGDG